MYNKKYILNKVEEFTYRNPVHTKMEGALCYLAYFNVKERGLFLYVQPDWYDLTPHRVQTSLVKEVQYIDDRVIVTTQNTRYTFKAITHVGDMKD